MEQALERKTPWHLWVVAIVSLLWHFGGANDYVQTQLNNTEYMAQAGEMMGVSVETIVTYFDGMPIWAHAAWAVGIWGAVLGSLLLLLRSRWALYSFIASLIGTAVSFSWQFTNPMEGVETGPFMIGMTVAIFVIEIILIFYARAMSSQGVLR